MNSREIRRIFLEFYKERGHEIVESSSLVPKDDPSLLFTNAGMVQFKRLYLGEEKRAYTRAATSQKCVRAGGKHNDLEQVGYTLRHHTFFEMLGNFSFGDYFKEEAISWAWELLTRVYLISPERLYVSVFKDDDEALRLWRDKVGMAPEKIVKLGEKDNFWAMGETGPCGPCSEIYFDQGPDFSCGRKDCAPGCDCERYLEIYNLVFTQFDRQPDGSFEPLPNPNIDTGMGLERLAAVIQGAPSNYETDILRGLVAYVEELSGTAYAKGGREDVAFRVISDHARAAAFLIADGVMPSNEGRGYVLRRIIRRAARFGHVLGLIGSFLYLVCGKVVEFMGEDYPELMRAGSLINGLVVNEEKRFSDTLAYSMKVLEEEISLIKQKGGKLISGDTAFKLYDTYGLSIDIVRDVARDNCLDVDTEGYEAAMVRQRAKSQESWRGSGEEAVPEVYLKMVGRGLISLFVGYDTLSVDATVTALVADGVETNEVVTGSEVEVVLDRTPFYGRAGGQVGDSGTIAFDSGSLEVEDTLKPCPELIVNKVRVVSGHLHVGDRVRATVHGGKRAATARNHSATHLMHAVLRELLGDHVKQAGSLVSSERLRFDFTHFAQVDFETIQELERRVNRYITDNLPVETMVMTKEDAMKTGAMAIFEERYGAEVRVVGVGEGVSRELCGGTHARRTGDIGLFRVVAETSVAANVRRIEAITGEAALAHDQWLEQTLRSAAVLLKTTMDGVEERLTRFIKEYKDKDREIQSLKSKLIAGKPDDILAGVREIGGVKVIARKLEADSPRDLREAADRIKDQLRKGVVVVGADNAGRAMLTCVVTKDLTGQFHAGRIITRLSGIVGGKGGGRPDMAQGGGSKPELLFSALEEFYRIVEEIVNG
ncbi:MAG TPA: alanine--tRNA ligase [Desulfobacteraceae bacterium]|nr:alanine--tRNA ligase [Desulfobacteraceae bacterium]